jgi:hypothetical protein
LGEKETLFFPSDRRSWDRVDRQSKGAPIKVFGNFSEIGYGYPIRKKFYIL